MAKVATVGEVRLLALLSAASDAGLSPLSIRAVHSLAFLANVLAPVWDIEPLDGKVFKEASGPFYPDLQADLDHLVGFGLVRIANVMYVVDTSGVWRLEAEVVLNSPLSDRAIRSLNDYSEEAMAIRLLRELCLAISGLPRSILAAAPLQDATFADPLIAPGNVIDFGEWQTKNYSLNAAQAIAALAPATIRLTPAEQVHLYIRHLQDRLTG